MVSLFSFNFISANFIVALRYLIRMIQVQFNLQRINKKYKFYFEGALAYAELGTLVLRSGSEYAYFFDSFGPLHKFWGNLPAFVFSWMMIIIIRPAETAVLILTFSEYACQPFFDWFCMNGHPQEDTIIKLVGLAALGL